MKQKMTWQEKLNKDHGLPEIKPIPPRMRKRFGKGTIVIPAPREVDEVISQVPKGKLITIPQIAEAIARKHKTSIACTVTVGIFAWTAAFAADEQEQLGMKGITPYWRVLKQNGEVNQKYPGGIENMMSRLENEGHEVHQKEQKILVENFEKKLIEIASIESRSLPGEKAMILKTLTLPTKASKETIWKLWSDARTWNQWDTDIEFATLDGDFIQYQTGAMKAKKAPKTKIQISELTLLKSFSVDFNLPLASVRFDHVMEEKDELLYITHTINFFGPLGFVFAKLLGRNLTQGLERALPKLIELAEEGAPQ